MHTHLPLEQRYLGCLLGLASGDALGTSVEFQARDSFTPLTDMRGGGVFNLKPGEWTDDTSMALCLAESLITQQGFNAFDQATRYCAWANEGHLSSNGRCFDIGNTVSNALHRFQQNRDPYAGATDPYSAGNGGIMRLAPIAMFYAHDESALLEYASLSSRITHGATEAIECAQLFSLQLRAALLGENKTQILSPHNLEISTSGIRAINKGTYKIKAREQIKGSGYVVESLEAALWCFHHSASYKEAVLMAANLGDDADTTAAITGQLAGAYYGVNAIPSHWLAQLAKKEQIASFALGLFAQHHAGR